MGASDGVWGLQDGEGSVRAVSRSWVRRVKGHGVYSPLAHPPAVVIPQDVSGRGSWVDVTTAPRSPLALNHLPALAVCHQFRGRVLWGPCQCTRGTSVSSSGKWAQPRDVFAGLLGPGKGCRKRPIGAWGCLGCHGLGAQNEALSPLLGSVSELRHCSEVSLGWPYSSHDPCGRAVHPVLQMGKLSLSKVRPRSRTQVRPGGEGLRFGGWGLPSRGRGTFPPQHPVRDVGLPAGPPGKAFPSSGQVVGRAPPPPLTTIIPLALCLAGHTLMLWLPASDGCELGSLPGNAECGAAGLGHGARTALKAPHSESLGDPQTPTPQCARWVGSKSCLLSAGRCRPSPFPDGPLSLSPLWL